MTKIKSFLGAVAASAVSSLLIASVVYAIGLSGLVINEPGLAYSKRFTFNLPALDVNTVTASAVYSSGTFATSTFSSGQVSTGSFLVVSNTLLSSAAATNALTVLSTSGALGDSLVLPFLNKPGAYVLTAGRDWNYGATTALTAASIKTALAQVPWISTNRVGAVIYATAPAGGYYTGLAMTTNNSDTLSIASATFLGGRDPATIYVNGYAFKAGRDFGVAATAPLTATNLANAINAKARLKDTVTASLATSSVTLVSDLAGALYNFALATSNSSAISVLHPTLIGGANVAWNIATDKLTLPSHAYPLALALLYSVGSGAPEIGGLTDQTTYFALPVDANTIRLSTSSANAQAGTYINLTSSPTLTASKSYSLAPLTFVAAATTGAKWQVSNDNASWSDLAVSSISWIGGGSVGGSVNWDLGTINYKYLSLNVVGPTSGGFGLQVTAQGSRRF